MKQSETSNGLWKSTGAILVHALVDGCKPRLVRTGLVAMVIDLLGCEILFAMGVSVELSHIASFSVAILIFTLNARATFPQFTQLDSAKGWPLYARLWILALLALLLRSGALSSLIMRGYWQPETALFVASLLGDATFLLGVVLFAAAGFEAGDASVNRWPVIAIGIVTYTFVLKLIFMGYVNLIPEEAYYWNYAQHLDIGYLDHPPMVAWLIWLSTSIFGKSEFAVRLPAYLCWIIAATFMVRLTFNLCGGSAAYRSALLLAVLPIYFGLGFFMTPDAPLFAAWSGSLYFVERALIGQDRRAWRWGGVCLGLGMLSKYSVALLGAAIIIFLIIDRESRRWLLRREPYAAAIIAMILFSPVLLWNLRNGWISFAFQGSGRWSGSYHFGFHVLIGSILLLLTPTGLLGIVRVLLPGRTHGATRSSQTETAKRQYLWTVILTIVPLSVFVVYSLINSPKLNWTAPVWLAAIPLLARDMAFSSDNGDGVWARLSRRLWMPTIVALLFIHGGFFYYVSVGMPGAGPMFPERLFGEWRELANKVGQIEASVEAKSGSKPVIVGMDKNFISNELSFYLSTDKDASYNTGGVHFFGGRSLMWAIWFPRSAAVGKDVLMIGFDRKRLMSRRLAEYFESLGDVVVERLEYNGRVVGHFYWRVGHVYRG